MSDRVSGRVLSVSSDGNIKIDPPSGADSQVGARFRVVNERGQQVADIKVVMSDASGTVARHFEPFVSDDVLRRAAGAGTGAVLGTILGGAISSALLLDPVLGSVVGAAIGSAIAGRSSTSKIRPDMKIIPIAGGGLASIGSGEERR